MSFLKDYPLSVTDELEITCETNWTEKEALAAMVAADVEFDNICATIIRIKGNLLIYSYDEFWRDNDASLTRQATRADIKALPKKLYGYKL